MAVSLRKIFVGPNGIRAGWRFLIFVALVVVFRVAAFRVAPVWRLLKMTQQSGTLTPVSDCTAAGLSAITAFLAAFIMSRIEKRRLTSYGIPLVGAFGRFFWWGVIWGLGMLTVEMLIIHALGGFVFGGFALHGTTLFQYAAAWAVSFILVGINEEFTFRGYPQFTLTTGMGFWPTAVLLSVLFGCVHLFNPNEGWVGALSVFLFGMFACLTLKRTGNLWFAIGFHAAADYGETFIYSVPNSGYVATGHLLTSNLHLGPRWLTGGHIGPEGSVFAFVLLGFAFCLFAWLYPRQRPVDGGSTVRSNNS
jgi:membrane protease YdiL (CAAX protease family)